MSNAPSARSAELEHAVRRARRAAAESGELDLPKGPFESPWPSELRAAVAQTLEDGTYAESASAVANLEPDLL